MTVPPYARIAADIKRRIDEGRLRPGERVPSTRQLARDWNVALATATKALAVLAREGVVTAEPRVGTVVADRPAAQEAQERRGARPEISGNEKIRGRIVRAAVAIADAEGLSEVTMRRVADRLGMATMSLYRHVTGKEELFLLMVDTVIEAFPLPAERPDGWRASLETSARVLWAAYRDHPWMAGVTSLHRPLASPALLRHSEWTMAALAGFRLDPTTKMYVNILLYSYVLSIAANVEQERRARAATGLTDEEWMSTHEERIWTISESGSSPAFAAFLRELGDFDLDLDHLFEFGLTRLLDGLTEVIG
ncbi:TetR/AcrR family transcriptional regulator C-terminal domain-containing protein [Nonomuraea aridisoli]|uniref:GntR family transcriptional regulator n=1 Tax=Nonomuraea aridisoli TaxID=2070368 RepID=A0A2W2DDN3_9ACTN|nr:GntR family transcriptional regulator [Nonomuraea aridisoli]PZG08511.1 GntR family transcriptional regulator [Nonomuraea aridisoli]